MSKESNMSEIYVTDEVIIYNDMNYGWAKGKNQPLWHSRVYMMWKGMWRRAYTEIYWFGSLIYPSFQYLSNFVTWIESQPNFDNFCSTCDRVRWSIDKDAKCPGNRNYYPEYMSLMLGSDNSKERINRKGNPSHNKEYVCKSSRKRMKPVLGIPLDKVNKIILTTSNKDVVKYGFDPSHISKCLTKKYKSHKDYKWYRVNYKHDKIYRRVII